MNGRFSAGLSTWTRSDMVPRARPSVARIAGSSWSSAAMIGAVRSSGAMVVLTVLEVPREAFSAVAVPAMPSTGPSRPVTPSVRSPTIIPWRVPGSASL